MTSLLNHAKHHEIAFEHLLQNNQCYGWSIIAAFYSSLKYIESALYPVEIEGVAYKSPAQYYNNYVVPKAKEENRIANRHHALIDLVSTKFPEIIADYRALFDMSLNIRYNSDMFNKQNKAKYTDIAHKRFRAIKEFCEVKIAEKTAESGSSSPENLSTVSEA